ncbi:DUF2007 domain-containing protein [Flavobacterium sp.]|jgi:DNA-directed RNA polymerase subunit RPC12/RpoP|uniref:DUF2007 domain-containing protein n=1 Tax=Flavobacterium sp. TaxID=239 RepID=UPI002A81CDC0|nr:DUF2007 domain-containing protein [Flavobacterium sp.]
MENEKFKLVSTYQYSSEAIIFKGKLESEEIEVFLRDNNTIDTDPLVSNAIGGVKMYVRTEDFERAVHVLSNISAFSLDNKGNLLKCPNCKQEKLQLLSVIDDAKSFFSMLLALMFFVLPFYTKYKYRCANCNYELEQKTKL